MAVSSNALIASIFLSFILLQLVTSHQQLTNGSDVAHLQKIDCSGLCAGRCKLSSRPNLCKRACGTCCERCNCVPPGTSGNQNVCPCYANMTTHGGKKKCP